MTESDGENSGNNGISREEENVGGEVSSEKSEVTELVVEIVEETVIVETGGKPVVETATTTEVSGPATKVLSFSALLSTMSLLMFVGGSLVTLMMLARAFNMHGATLVAFVIVSCTVVLAAAGGLLLKTMGDKGWIGAVLGGCFGAIAAILIYAQTRHLSWWQ